MIYLICAVVVVGLLCVFDLFLTFAVLRRLRENTAELDRLSASRPEFEPWNPAELVGSELPELAGGPAERVVAFFDAHCDVCHEHAPHFAEEARAFDGAAAVVSGKGPQAEELLTAVGGEVPVTRVDEAMTLVKTIGLKAFPTYALVDADGTITRAATSAGALASRVPAA
ncbi:TlpA family protein disulfide reductase [Streptomyces sp. t39]|uniref:TlpA family protein disulfide reductase n=1 Tax=Streptomyces sp. t39 TaxID=1828156 RepID=UPI0011CE65B0|nr:hypothetical protein [Streptomyces sp. t39]TXS55695.1 hypothetical protein EAO77_05605 [Streptomyces sp. t39]